MSISIFELFKIGIGPSSSHTVGPMRAAKRFLLSCKDKLSKIDTLHITLYGSLAHTCYGHGTNKAIIMGLVGEDPETIDPATIRERIENIQTHHKIKLLNQHEITFNPAEDLKLELNTLLEHFSNGMLFIAYDRNKKILEQNVYYSIGGGFIITAAEVEQKTTPTESTIPHPFNSAKELLAISEKHKISIAKIMLENEKTWRSEDEIKKGLLKISEVMEDSINRGCNHPEGILAGGLNVRRRAPALYQFLKKFPPGTEQPRLMNWLNLYAMAVNEENAAGHRVVTAPTNGAAGIIPAVLNYYKYFTKGPTEEGILILLLTAGAIGILYKKNASISGAEMGCQGEVGVACSMAAGGLAAALGGSINQVENAAEIGMEHNLGLTCDPVAGLVQIPCIERNAMGAVKAVNAAELALAEDGKHIVSLDMVINTMREIGSNMNTIYKETSKGGLAVNVPEC